VIRYTAWTVSGLGLLTLSVTAALAGLTRLVANGSCANHPAFVSTRPCPPGTEALILVVGAAFFTGFAGWAAYQLRAPRSGPSPWRDGPDYGWFWWPALFLGGATLFFGAMRDFRAAGATGDAWGMGVAGAVFAVMGGAPLLVVARRLPALLFGGPRPPSWLASATDAAAGAIAAARAAARAASVPDPHPPIGAAGAAAGAATSPATSAATGATAGGATPTAGDTGAFVDALERLAGLHRRGVLDDGEFAAAKARLLGRDGAGDAVP
jgi:hypothetical protein